MCVCVCRIVGLNQGVATLDLNIWFTAYQQSISAFSCEQWVLSISLLAIDEKDQCSLVPSHLRW